MQLKALTSAALLAGAQAFVAPGASKPALALRAEGETAAVIGKLEAHTEGAGPQVSVTGTEAWGWA